MFNPDDALVLLYTNHAAIQLRDRYATDSERADWVQAFLDITGNKSVLLAKQSNGRERHIVKVAGTAVIAVYCPNTARIITVLPATATGRKHDGYQPIS